MRGERGEKEGRERGKKERERERLKGMRALVAAVKNGAELNFKFFDALHSPDFRAFVSLRLRIKEKHFEEKEQPCDEL